MFALFQQLCGMLQTYHPDIIGRSITGQCLQFVKKTGTAHVMPAAEQVYIEVRTSHVILYAFLDGSYEFPIQRTGAINWKILFFIFNTIIKLAEQSSLDFTALNTLPAAELKVSSKLLRKNGQAEIRAAIAHLKSAKGVAFAVYVQAVRTSDGERILPAIMNDNYFTLMPGETKDICITFDEALLQGGSYKLLVTPYNNK